MTGDEIGSPRETGPWLRGVIGPLALLVACTGGVDSDGGRSPAPAAVADGGAAAPGPSEAELGRKLIRSATLRMEVETADEAASSAAELVRATGGFLADRKLSRGGEGASQARLMLRVPEERLDELLEGLRRLGEVREESLATEDVTRSYLDLETRLSVKRDAAERLRAILRDRAGNLSEVLEVEQALARLVEEIEKLEGKRRFYDDRVALATVELVLGELFEAEGPSLAGSVRGALRDSVELLSGSARAMVYCVAFVLPWAPLLLGAAWLLRRSARGREGRE